MIIFFDKYVDQTVKNIHYHRYFRNGPEWLQAALKKDKEDE